MDTPAFETIEVEGHCPTALAKALWSLNTRYPGMVMNAVFEPRSNTARTKVLQTGFTRALGFADEVYIGAVNRAGKLNESERFDVEAVIQQLELQGIPAYTAETNAALLEKIIASTRASQQPQLVIFFTNGSFDGIISRYVDSATG